MPSHRMSAGFKIFRHFEQSRGIPKGISILVAAAAFVSSILMAQEAPPYKNPALPVEASVADLLKRMTPEEKARQLDMFFGCESVLEPAQVVGKTHAKPEAVFNPQLAEKAFGTLGAGSIHDLYPRPGLYNAVQRWLIKSN